jgi:GNAT superfamily N-acetyltransferase
MFCAMLWLGMGLPRELRAALSSILDAERKVLLHDVLVRPARLGDAEALQRHCYPEASLDDVRDYLAWCLRQGKGRILRLVAEVDGQAVGNAQLTVWGQVGEIGSLVVAEAHRQHGVARKMLAALIAWLSTNGWAFAGSRIRKGDSLTLPCPERRSSYGCHFEIRRVRESLVEKRSQAAMDNVGCNVG